MTASPAFLEHRQRLADDTGTLTLLEISHPAFSAPFRLANDDSQQVWVSRGHTYIGAQFAFQPPDDDGNSPQMRLVMANPGQDLLAELLALDPGDDDVLCRVMVADRSEPDVYALDISMPLARITLSVEQITATPSAAARMDRSAVLLRYDQRTAPGVH